MSKEAWRDVFTSIVKATKEDVSHLPKHLYHGTSPMYKSLIDAEGFKVNNESKQMHLGSGIYFALTEENARDYGKPVIEIEPPKDIQYCKGKNDFEEEGEYKFDLIDGIGTIDLDFSDDHYFAQAWEQMNGREFPWSDDAAVDEIQTPSDKLYATAKQLYEADAHKITEGMLKRGCQALIDYSQVVFYDPNVIKKLKPIKEKNKL